MSFTHLGLSAKVIAAVDSAGYKTPTPVQDQAIPHVLARRDVLGIAQTGTGKTAAFVLPMLTMLEKGRAPAPAGPWRHPPVRGRLLLSGVELLVIDEADRLLDMGFIPDIERIGKLVPFTRQTLFFTATMPPEIQRIADNFLHNPVRVEVSKPATAAVTINQLQVS